jgi:hypothetical protein
MSAGAFTYTYLFVREWPARERRATGGPRRGVVRRRIPLSASAKPPTGWAVLAFGRERQHSSSGTLQYGAYGRAYSTKERRITGDVPLFCWMVGWDGTARAERPALTLATPGCVFFSSARPTADIEVGGTGSRVCDEHGLVSCNGGLASAWSRPIAQRRGQGTGMVGLCLGGTIRRPRF